MRIISFLICTVISVMLLTACGGKDANKANENAEEIITPCEICTSTSHTTKDHPSCKICGNYDHTSNDCVDKVLADGGIICTFCGNEGHMISSCPHLVKTAK